MSLNFSKNNQLSLTPLGAGDLIDRAVRFYRRNFWTLVLIAAPPIIFGTLISVGWTMFGRELFRTNLRDDVFENSFYYLFLWFGSVVIWLVELIAALIVMGGAARNFVRHLLFGEPLSFRETYRNSWKRLFGLIVASSLLTVMLAILGNFILGFGLIIGLIAIGIAANAFQFAPLIAFLVALVLGLGTAFVTLWLFFLIASRVAYVPQVMLVENQGVFAAIGRSASLASGNVKRLAALFLFTLVAIYSALALFYVPLGVYAWANGVEIFTFDPDQVPAWYQIASQVVSQASLILLSPVWMIGLCLLYVDERVRHEGYDLELLAAQRLGEIPAVPRDFVNPLQPALANQAGSGDAPRVSSVAAQKQNSPLTTLGLK